MNKAIGFTFIIFAAAAVVFAFSPRPDPQMLPTRAHIDHLLMLDVQPLGERLVGVGERGFIFVSDDGGTSWRSVPSPTAATLTALAAIDGTRAVAVGHDAVILRTGDGGETWTTIQDAPEDEEPLLAVHFDADGRGFAAGAYGRFLASRDGGLSWEERAVGDEDLHLNAVTRVAGALLMAGEAGTLLRSDDDGETWEALDAPYGGSFFGLLAIPDGGVLAFGMRGHVFRSVDGGFTWEEIDTGTHASIFGGRVVSPERVVLAGQNGLVLASGDQGRSFAAVDVDTGRTLVAVAPGAAAGEVLLVGEEGVLKAAVPAQAGRGS